MTPHARRTRSRRLLVAALLIGSAGLAGCGGGDDGTALPDGVAEESVSGALDTWPLTGLPVEDGTSVRRQPVLVVKIDNTSSSEPQRGLDGADLVVEELVEGGITRLAAFFYSGARPGVVGPVRSVRATDLGVAGPADGVLVTSGGAPVTLRRLAEGGIDLVTEGSPGFARDAGRSAPYNLMVDLDEAGAALRGDAVRPPDYLDFGSVEDLPGGRPAVGVDARFSAAHTTSFSYDAASEQYVDTDSHAAADEQFPADSVLVLRVRTRDAGYKDPAGNPVPETVLDGRGRGTLLHGGRAVPLRWSKAGLDAPVYLESDGTRVDVPAGRTWIALVPRDGGDVTLTRR